MIKCFIFDIAGVLFEERFLKVISEHEKKYKLKQGALYHIIHDLVPWKDYTLGEVSEKDYWFEANKYLPELDTNALSRDIVRSFKIRPELFKFIKSLKGKFRFCLVSNTPREWLEAIDQKYHFLPFFEVKSVSGLTGIRKPDKKAYQIVLRETGLKADECLVIDDSSEKIKTPKEMGFHVLRYTAFKSFHELADIIVNENKNTRSSPKSLQKY